MFLSNYYSNNTEIKHNAQNELGLFAKNTINKGDIISNFPLNKMILSDTTIIQKLKKSLAGIIPDNNIARFSLAINILYHPKKYDFVHKHILNNYSPHKPFLFKDIEMKLLKDTITYYLIRTEKLYFELMITQYRQFESDITYDAEHKLKVIYSYCTSRSHNIHQNDTLISCINPCSIINHITHIKYPKLKHEIKNSQWIVYADKQYEIGEEILDCYRLNTNISHPYYNKLQFNDSKISTAIFNGITSTDIEPNMGFKLDNDINENNIALLDKIYSKDRMKNINITSGDKRHIKCVSVIHKLLDLEMTYYDNFKQELNTNTTDVNLEIT